jgi:hypothetical protein
MAAHGGDGGGGGHGHHHGHGGGLCSCEHDHDDNDPSERGTLYSLYLKVDTERVRCLNEAHDGSAKTIFKPWHERLDKERFLESDVDPELLLHIPFTGSVKLKGVIVIGGEEDTHPSVMKLYKNRPEMTFDDSSSEADQEFEMQPDSVGTLEYVTKAARFNSVHHLSILFPRNFGAETTKIYYIGLRGDFTQAHRQEILVTTYEARANPADHKTSLFDTIPHEVQ